MDSLIGILSLCALFLILILIMVIVLVLEVKRWASKRDGYYNEQMKGVRNEVAELKSEIIKVLNEIR
jgi:hypothetical protein